MDQLVALGVQALKAYKEQLDAAAEKVEIARALVKKSRSNTNNSHFNKKTSFKYYFNFSCSK